MRRLRCGEVMWSPSVTVKEERSGIRLHIAWLPLFLNHRAGGHYKQVNKEINEVNWDIDKTICRKRGVEMSWSWSCVAVAQGSGGAALARWRLSETRGMRRSQEEQDQMDEYFRGKTAPRPQGNELRGVSEEERNKPEGAGDKWLWEGLPQDQRRLGHRVTRVQKGRFMGALAEKGTRDAVLLILMSLKCKSNLEL